MQCDFSMSMMARSKFYKKPSLFMIEYNPDMALCFLPGIFSKVFKEDVPRRVVLRDPYQNLIHLVVRRDGDDLLFTHGWTMLKDIYDDLSDEGWLKFNYVGGNEFDIKVMHRWLGEVNYPVPGKEYKHEIEYLPEEVIPGYKVQHADDFHYVDKKMADYLCSNHLLNLSSALCKRFRGRPTNCCLKDVDGVVTPITLKWGKKGHIAYITRGWRQFCSAGNLKKDSIVRFRVDPDDSNTIYVRIIEDIPTI